MSKLIPIMDRSGIMKNNILKVLLILVISSLALMGCSEEEKSHKHPAQEVVEKHFQYKKEKNINKFISTHSETMEDIYKNQGVYKWDTLKDIKLLSIDEEKDENYKKGYLTNGRGSINGTTAENLKVYKVEYEIKFNAPGPQESGRYTWWYYVIRKDTDSPWLIDDYGI